MYGPFMESVRAKFLTALVMTLALALPLASCGRTETDGMGSGGVGGVTGGVSTGGRSTGGAGMISGGAVGTGGGEGRIVCLANQHVQANACVACGVGTTNAAGDDARGESRKSLRRCVHGGYHCRETRWPWAPAVKIARRWESTGTSAAALPSRVVRCLCGELLRERARYSIR